MPVQTGIQGWGGMGSRLHGSDGSVIPDSDRESRRRDGLPSARERRNAYPPSASSLMRRSA